MRKSWITLGAFFICVAALGLFVWLKPPKPQNATHAVSVLKSAEVRTLRVQRKGKALAVLEKRADEWFLIEPLTAPADAFQVSRLLAVLEAKSALQYPLSDLAKFELNTPQAELTINDQRFVFGAINNVTREQYVLTQNHVYPLELRFAAAIPNDAAALLRRSVLAPGDTPLRFEFGAFTVAFDEKKWTTAPSPGDVSQDDYNRWVAQWREGSALRTEPVDKRAATEEIYITLKNGNKVSLDIVQTQPELIVRHADLGLQFVFVGTIGAQMMAAPGTSK
ncbi:MAG TPA: DUF4340 domain-containing protein [Burkholderiales bacterium]|nr:DUF4340 domain-containing protein [Burkholderiales bacterium]